MNTKKIVSMILAIALVFTLFPVNAQAETAEKPTLTVDTTAITDGTMSDSAEADDPYLWTNILPADTVFAVDQTFYVPVKLTGMAKLNTVQLAVDYNDLVLDLVSLNTGWGSGRNAYGHTILSSGFTVVPNPDENKITASNGTGADLPGSYHDYLVFLGFKVIDKSPTGSETISLRTLVNNAPGVNAADSNIADADITYVSGTVSVEKASSGEEGGESGGTTSTSGYDIFYTLDSETDVLDVNGASGTDNYMEYGVVDGEKKPTKVTATVKLKNTGEATTLQAYDVYLTYDTTGLKYVGHNMSGAVAYEAGSETAIVVTDETAPVVSHIQAVSESFTAQTLGQGAEVTLGTITFEILPAAVYDQELRITLTEGTGSKTVTNISVGGEAQGDQQAYYPTNTSTVLGAEVNTTYKVTWKNGDTTLETDEKAPYGLTPIYDGAKPEKTDDTGRYTYTFVGWNIEDGKKEGIALPNVTEDAIYFAAFSEVENFRTITFHANDGSETPETKTQKFTPGVDTNLEANTFEKTGHTFAGWATTADGEVVYEDGAAINVTTDTDLYAKWTPVKYNIKFVDDDNTTVLKETEVDYGTKPEAPADPTKQEDAMYTYEFAGWDPAIAVVTGDATYKATYEKTAKVYKVEWMVDNVAIQTDNVAYGKPIPAAPANPSKDGYNFVKWDSIPATMPAEDVVINATWEAIKYTITFNVNGGEMDNGASLNKTYTIKDKIDLPTASIDNQNFDGWSVEVKDGNWDNAKTYSGTIESGMYGNVTLKATWSNKPLTVGTSVTNGSVDVSNVAGGGINANVGDTIKLTLNPTLGYELAENMKVQFTYTEGGVSKSGEATKNEDGTYSFRMPNADNVEGTDVTVTVEFTAIVYTITYMENGGSEVADGSYTVKDSVTLPTTSTKDGYTFGGWYESEAFAGSKVTEIEAGTIGNKTYYAKWDGIQYTVVFDKNADDATGTVNNIPATYGADVVLKGQEYARIGYTFSGWNTQEDGTGTAYDADATIKEALFTPNAEGQSTTLYAVWTENQYTIKYDDSNGVTYADDVDKEVTTGYDDPVTLPTAAQVTKPGYTLTGWTTDPNVQVGDEPTYTTTASKLVAENNGEVTLYPVWNYVDYTVTIGKITNGDVTASKTENVHVDEPITLTPTPNKGYGEVTYTVTYEDANGTSQPVEVSGNTFTMPAGDVTVTASFSAKQYTIRFELNGGDWESGTTAPSNPMTYCTTDDTALPTNLVKDKYTFTGWTVSYAAEYPEEEQGWGKTGDPITKESKVTSRYGNVILTAQWDVEFKYEVEEYVYAPTDYVMLRIAATSEDNVYSFKYAEDDVRNMFYTDDSNYKVGDSFAFVTLIPKEGNIAQNAETGKWELTAAAVKKLNETEDKAVSIVRDGDVNHDDVVNIADANVVYQMVSRQEVRGSYYSMSQLDIYDRLVADMKTATSGSDKRGTLEDVSLIVAEINKG